jgi:hypothetical protein
MAACLSCKGIGHYETVELINGKPKPGLATCLSCMGSGKAPAGYVPKEPATSRPDLPKKVSDW